LGVELDKEMLTSDWSAPTLSKEQLEYAEPDAKIALDLYDHLCKRLREEGFEKVCELENRVRPAVDAMERYGVAIHRDRLEALIEEATERVETLKAELEAEWSINPGSSKQLIKHFGLAERAGWPLTKGGKPSTEQEALALLFL
jgi:DNA polymerase I-like protein with 3'-5' exonuclease and polymerase domains